MRIAFVFTLTAVLLSSAVLAQTPLGSAFTYQGQLKQGGTPLTGSANFEFRLFDAAGSGSPPTGGNQVGSTVTHSAVSVAAGQFTVSLDFGVSAFDGNARWLQITVNANTLAPRQPLTVAPYALQTRGIYVAPNGAVGIGTSSPEAALDVVGSGRFSEVRTTNAAAATTVAIRGAEQGLENPVIRLFNQAGANSAVLSSLLGFGDLVLRSVGGSERARLSASEDGIDAGNLRLYNAANNNLVVLGCLDDFGRLVLRNGLQQNRVEIGANEQGQDNSVVRLYNSDAQNVALIGALNGYGSMILRDQQGNQKIALNAALEPKLDVTGTTRTHVLQITGGADLAEKMPTTDKLEPGMLAIIDEAGNGKLRLATEPYDRKVAGIVSGANDFPAGAILGNQPGSEDDPPIALAGRVYCWADASYGPIEPGDRLTTSATPGHAMKATDRDKADGAVIGKAMTKLESGKGLVFVLVQPQ